MTAPLIFKALGCAFILGSGVFAGNLLNQADTAKLSQLEAIISLLKFIRLQIDYYCVPVKEIFARAEPSLLIACGTTQTPESFRDFLSSLSPMPSNDITSILISFSNELGGSYREEQLRSCDYHINRLEELHSAISKEAEKRKKLNRVLPFSIAAAIVILLI